MPRLSKAKKELIEKMVKERIFNEEEQETNRANAHYNNPNPNVDGDIDIIQER